MATQLGAAGGRARSPVKAAHRAERQARRQNPQGARGRRGVVAQRADRQAMKVVRFAIFKTFGFPGRYDRNVVASNMIARYQRRSYPVSPERRDSNCKSDHCNRENYTPQRKIILRHIQKTSDKFDALVDLALVVL